MSRHCGGNVNVCNNTMKQHRRCEFSLSITLQKGTNTQFCILF